MHQIVGSASVCAFYFLERAVGSTRRLSIHGNTKNFIQLRTAGDMGNQSLKKARLKRKQAGEKEAAKVDSVVRNEANVAMSPPQKRRRLTSQEIQVDKAREELEVTRWGVITAAEELRTAEEELRVAPREKTDLSAEVGKVTYAKRKLRKAYIVDEKQEALVLGLVRLDNPSG